jgi:hypothetical protein
MSTSDEQDSLLGIHQPASTTSDTTMDTSGQVVRPEQPEIVKVTFTTPTLLVKCDSSNSARPAKEKVMRFSPLPTDVAGPLATAQARYVDANNPYRCLGTEDAIGYCCLTVNDERDAHVVVPVLLYTNAHATGRLPKGAAPEWELGCLAMSRTTYQRIQRLPDDGFSIADLDIVMFKEGKNEEISFARTSPRPHWTLDPQVRAEVVKAAEEAFLQSPGRYIWRATAYSNEQTANILRRLTVDNPRFAELCAALADHVKSASICELKGENSTCEDYFNRTKTLATILANVVAALHPHIILNRDLVTTHAVALLLGDQQFANNQKEPDPDEALCHEESCYGCPVLWCPKCGERYCKWHMVPTEEHCVFCEEKDRL